MENYINIFYSLFFFQGQWALDHIRAGKNDFKKEIEQNGFEMIEEPNLGLSENYCMVFIKKDDQYL